MFTYVENNRFSNNLIPEEHEYIIMSPFYYESSYATALFVRKSHPIFTLDFLAQFYKAKTAKGYCSGVLKHQNCAMSAHNALKQSLV